MTNKHQRNAIGHPYPVTVYCAKPGCMGEAQALCAEDAPTCALHGYGGEMQHTCGTIDHVNAGACSADIEDQP